MTNTHEDFMHAIFLFLNLSWFVKHTLFFRRELKTFLGAEMIGLDGLFEVYNVSNKQVTLDLLKERKV